MEDSILKELALNRLGVERVTFVIPEISEDNSNPLERPLDYTRKDLSPVPNWVNKTNMSPMNPLFFRSGVLSTHSQENKNERTPKSVLRPFTHE